MGIVKTSLIAASFTLGLAGAANAATYTAADNSPESDLCVAAATASKMQMHSKVADFRASAMAQKNYRLVANKVFCNGQNIAEFALNAGNTNVATKLNSYRVHHVEIRDIANANHGYVHIGSK